ncbi:NACHT domain-containing protein [Mycena venus]|uniref:NACHT domain-containing protein n=1 Tax=Mycena venus TaxID=2733690 RepID=A0A8H7CEK9_9AGAR|nr:NACHT domain-containing protein [Mycena venus]
MPLVPQEPPVTTSYRLHIQSGGTFHQVAGNHNEYKYNVAGNFVQSRGENGISLLQRNISGDSLHNSEQRFPPPLCHPDTRIAVQNIIQDWVEDIDNQAPNVMWLYGPAGAGKSAVAQSMAENWAANNRLAASFFFARWRAGGSLGESLFPTIAYQLALHIPGLRHLIGLAVEEDPAICDKTLDEQFYTLIVNPISLLPTKSSWPYLIIIDGLDECDSKPMQSRIISIISQELVYNNLPMRFLICSRPEPHIRESFDSLPDYVHFRRLILDETFNPGRDILRYLRDRLTDIRRRRLPRQDVLWPSERDLERLVHCASGQFIYVAIVVKFVDDEYCHPVDQLSAVLDLSATGAGQSPFSELDTLYSHILSANPNISIVMQILGGYFAIPEMLAHPERQSVGFLDEILGLRSGSTTIQSAFITLRYTISS